MTETSAFTLSVPFGKLNDDERLVFGWASVVTKGGRPVIDLQDDMIEVGELRKAVEAFMDGSRDAGYMHERGDDGKVHRIGKIVDSLVVTADVAKALGIATDQEGWIIGVRVESEDVWKRVKAGELSAFSIGGMAARIEADDEAA